MCVWAHTHVCVCMRARVCVRIGDIYILILLFFYLYPYSHAGLTTLQNCHAKNVFCKVYENQCVTANIFFERSRILLGFGRFC